MLRYKLLFSAIALAMSCYIAGCASSSNAIVEETGNDFDAGVKDIRTLVTGDNAVSRKIMWTGDKSGKYVVELRELNKKDGVQKYPAKDASFKILEYDYPQFAASLTGLKAGSSYQYRINNGKELGAWHKLKTDNGRKLKALVFPDSQSADYRGWKTLAEKARQENRDAELFINMGDLVDNGQHQWQWQEWFRGVESFSSELAFAPVLGNHETYSLKWEEDLPETYINLFQLPENGSERFQNHYYSFDYGPVHFTVLDSNYADEEEDSLPALGPTQLAWAREDLANSSAKWKVVLMHRDILLYGFSEESGRARRWDTHWHRVGLDYAPLFDEFKVDAVLTAHLHTYRRRKPMSGFAVADKGVTYIMTGVAGDVRYATLWEDWEGDAARAPKPETANYMTLEADEHSLEFKAFLPDGKEFDRIKLTK